MLQYSVILQHSELNSEHLWNTSSLELEVAWVVNPKLYSIFDATAIVWSDFQIGHRVINCVEEVVGMSTVFLLELTFFCL